MTFWRRGRQRPYDLILDRPQNDVIGERIQLLAGFVQSSEPLPPLTLTLNDVVQTEIVRSDLGDSNAPWDRRHTAYWNLYCETARLMNRRHHLDLDVYIEGRRIGHRRFRCDLSCDRTTTGRPLVFLMHIPKTAGTSLRTALEARQPDLRLLNVYDTSAYLTLSQCRSFSARAFEDLDVVMGHYEYGLHRLAGRDFKYVTVLRRPAAFLRSYYLFTKALHPALYAGCATIEDAIETGVDSAFDNPFTRYIAGDVGAGPVGACDYERAVQNIERDFAFVGLAEDMNATTDAIGSYLGCPLAIDHLNATPFMPEAATIDLDALDRRFGDHWIYDRKLYALAGQRYDPAAIKRLGSLPAARSQMPSPGLLERLARKP